LENKGHRESFVSQPSDLNVITTRDSFVAGIKDEPGEGAQECGAYCPLEIYCFLPLDASWNGNIQR